jgi:anti-sigma factor RsiW
MDCRETRELLIAFHDGELPEADRARVEAHLAGCDGCRALLSDLARTDDAVGVPDPGPEYWERFNARVMDRVAREADGPAVATLRPKRSWLRDQWRYLVPAAAAAALVIAVVRHAGFDPGAPPASVAPQAVPERANPLPPGNPSVDSPAPSRPRSPVPVPDGQRPATAKAESRPAELPVVADRLAASKETSIAASGPPPARERLDAPANEMVVKSAPPPPPAPLQAKAERYALPAPAPAAPAPTADARGGAAFSEAERSAYDGLREAKSLETRILGKAKRSVAEPVRPETFSAGATLAGAAGPGPAPAAKADASPGAAARDREPPCEKARRLYAEGRYREAEIAQRACLAADESPESQESGTVFLAELLDRQSRFAEADSLLAKAQRRFPLSRSLDDYRQQRPAIQRQQMIPAAR